MDNMDLYQDNLEFYEDWINIDDFELKILMLTGLLSDNNLAYRGTLKTMCEWLGVKSSAVNNRNIKEAINNLKEQEYIFCDVEGRTYHLSIRNKGLKDKKIIKIRKKWIETLKKYNEKSEAKNISIDWIKVLKVFVYIYSLNNSNLITYSTISDDLNISSETVRKALNIITSSDLDNISVSKDIVRTKIKCPNGKDIWRTKGTDLSVMVKL